MRAAIIEADGYLDKRLERILTNNSINGDIVTKLTTNMINVYDCVIFSHKNDIPNLQKLIERIVLEKKILVIYVTNTLSVGYYYTLVNNLYFNLVNEQLLDIELPIMLKSSIKYLNTISKIEKENKEIIEQIKTIKLTNKAKQILMSKGLTEADSHHFIQQKAMKMRIPKKKLVNLIIENKIDI